MMIQQHKHNRTFLNNERQFNQQVKTRSIKRSEQPDANKIMHFLIKLWRKKQHNQKAELLHDIKDKLQGTKDIPEAKTHLHS